MKQYYLLLILLAHLNFLPAQTREHFKLSKPKVVYAGKTINIGSNRFSFTAADHLNYLVMRCYNFKEVNDDVNSLKDSIEYSPYQSKFYRFNSKNNEYVILWVTEYEYYPGIMAYYLKEGNISKIGMLEIAGADSMDESFEYPIECIRVSKLGDSIEFSFSKDLNYKIKDNDWKLYKAGFITYRYIISQKKFEVIL